MCLTQKSCLEALLPQLSLHRCPDLRTLLAAHSCVQLLLHCHCLQNLSGAPRDELLWPWVGNKAFSACPMLLLPSVRWYPLLQPGEPGHELGWCLLVPVVAASVTAYSGCFLGRTGVALGVLKAASSIRGSRADSGLGESGLGCSSSCLCSATPVIEGTW